MGTRLTLGYSPCPNDTFIFHALVKGLVPSEGLSFTETLADVETLNQWALEGRLDITKVSFGVIPHVLDRYCILRAGGALGRGCGPLIVTKGRADIPSLINKPIAIPGIHTTAYLLMRLREPGLCANTIPMPFDRIMPAVQSGEAAAGLIIHEGRFTYPGYGLTMVEDLGQWWEAETGMPIPLGAIMARRSLGAEIIGATEGAIRASLKHAFDDPATAMPYIKAHSQELSDDVIQSHIRLYVNDFSMDMGAVGEAAVRELFRRAAGAGLPVALPLELFSR